MGAHAVVLELLQIPYEKVSLRFYEMCSDPVNVQMNTLTPQPFPLQGEDLRMQDIMKLAHHFLQNFCAGNQQNQALLHKHINLFLNPGVSSPTRLPTQCRSLLTISYFDFNNMYRCSSLFFFLVQILEAITMQHIFMNNFQLCSEINERVVQHFVHCIETHGRNVQYLKFLQTIVKAENKFIKKCQDIVMAEVIPLSTCSP